MLSGQDSRCSACLRSPILSIPKLVDNVNYFRDKMIALGFDIKPTQSAICAGCSTMLPEPEVCCTHAGGGDLRHRLLLPCGPQRSGTYPCSYPLHTNANTSTSVSPPSRKLVANLGSSSNPQRLTGNEIARFSSESRAIFVTLKVSSLESPHMFLGFFVRAIFVEEKHTPRMDERGVKTRKR